MVPATRRARGPRSMAMPRDAARPMPSVAGNVPNAKAAIESAPDAADPEVPAMPSAL